MTDIIKLADGYASALGDARADLGANAGMDEQDPMWIAMKEARAALQSAIETLQAERDALALQLADMRALVKTTQDGRNADVLQLQVKLSALQTQEPVAVITASTEGNLRSYKTEVIARIEDGIHNLYAAPKALEPHEDTNLLNYLQERQATVEILMDSQGISVPLFRIGGLHGSICADIRGAIRAAHGITKGNQCSQNSTT